MAPSRRKGGKKAAAAVAASRQWKVGDLVLAKVKGFPAWPATVSEPEKWGYSADWKKVLVYFFGTQQIAFCNHADVEAFTEEKKQSLLIKRQGRGADFVRAVHEIIESYENSKKQDQVDSNSGDEVTVANGGNSIDLISHSGLKGRTEASEATLDSQMKPSESTAARNGPTLPAEDAPVPIQLDALPSIEALPEQPSDKLVVKATPVLTTYSSRKRTGGSRSQSTERVAPSTRRLKNSTRVESCILQNFMIPYNNESKDAVEVSANVIQDGSLRRNKRMRKSPDAFECNVVDSSALLSNGSIEDNSSEIVTVESDAFSLNEVSTVDSGCKVEHSGTVLECLDGNVELSKGFDFQIKAAVFKKKRKPNRKRASNDAADPPARIDTETELDVGTCNTSYSSENTGGNLDERNTKEVGDEHLPLVKRARVRMGKPSSAEELKTSSQTEEKPSQDVTVNLLEHISPSVNNDDEGLIDGGPSSVKGSTDNVSPSKVCSEISGNRLQLWKGTKFQSFGCSADGEAALPPSKRLHRALEAMSANAAEEGQACVEASSSISTSINGCRVDGISKCSHETMESREGDGLGLQNVESLGNDASGFYSTSSPMDLERSAKSYGEAHTCHQLTETSNGHRHERCRDDLGPVDNADGKGFNGSPFCVCTIQTVVQTQSPENILLDPENRESCFQSDQDYLDHLPLKDEDNTENLQLKDFRAENDDKELDTLEHTNLSLDPVSGADESAKLSPQNGSNELHYSVQGMSCENTKSLKSQIDNCHINAMCEAVEESIHKEKQKDLSFVSISDDRLGDKGITSAPLSSSPVEGVDSLAWISRPNTFLCHKSTSESSNIVQSSSFSPRARTVYEKSLRAPAAEGKIETVATQRLKSVGTWNSSSEAHAALSSFEAVLRSLTRTKESIGRATRVAMECAKFGLSTKVVEILARHLESESSLHRRVDLFFLVDSIMQCSRGMKGDVGSIYPSAVLTVLPRLLLAAAPPGSVAQENRRQCLKVLRLWLERRILPESIIRHHMRELDTFICSSSGAYSRRSARTERALDDPVRDLEGMLVDEYGSNSSFQLPGFFMPCMLKDDDDGSDSDGGSFEAVTPEHNSEMPEERDNNSIKRHRHILEQVDDEHEMEDVAPTCDIEMSSTPVVDIAEKSHDQLLSFVPPLPQDVPPSSPPLPSSPPPPHPPPPLPLPHPCALSDPYSNGPSMQNMQNDVQQSVTQLSVAPRINPTMSANAVHYRDPECRDSQMPMQMSESTSSFGSYPVCPSDTFQQTDDGPMLHSKPYPPRPPHAPHSNQFSYVQAGQNAKSRREASHPSNSHRFHPQPNIDGGNFYNNHDRMKPGPYEDRGSWRIPAPCHSGPRYPDEARECYASGSYAGPPREPPRYSNRDWAYPPRPMNLRHMRPPSGGAVPVGIRAPGMWRPR